MSDIRESSIRGGAYSQFQGGAIHWSAANDAIDVRKGGDSRGPLGRGAEAGVVASGRPPVLLPATDPGPLGKGGADGSLNDTPWESFPGCTAGIPPVVQSGLVLLGNVLKGLGAEAPTLDARCGTYTREIASGVTLGAPFGGTTTPPSWASSAAAAM